MHIWMHKRREEGLAGMCGTLDTNGRQTQMRVNVAVDLRIQL